MPADDASILDTEPDAWQRVQDVNTKGVFLCCKHGIPYLLERGGGSVINVASFVAILGAATSQISYTAPRARCCRSRASSASSSAASACA
jgi:NAD(P)-dependent dehydrogenase (short-subunit alcohol dehydrogenase family)